MLINDKRRINSYRILCFLLILTIGIVFITLFLFPLHSGRIGLIWNKIVLPFEMAFFPTIFICFKLCNFLYQKKKEVGKYLLAKKL